MKTSRDTSRRGFARLALGAAICCFALLAFTGAAHAGSWGSVAGDGSLLKSRGVLANYHDSTDLYRIVFRKKIDNCVPVVSMRGTFGLVRAFLTGSPGEVVIEVADPDLSAYIDGSFHIALVS
jgi:hypothetical protein